MVAKPAVTVVLLPKKEGVKFPPCIPQDMGAAVENLLLGAVELGLGAVWLGIAPIQERMNYIKNMFGLPEGIEPYRRV